MVIHLTLIILTVAEISYVGITGQVQRS